MGVRACTLNECGLSAEQSLVWAEDPIETAPVSLDLTPRSEVIAGDVSTSTLRLFVRSEAQNRGLDPDLIEALVKAESGFVWDAKNTSSTASGLFQFLTGTFSHYCTTDMTKKNDPIIQTDCALTMIANGGLSHWDASRPHWQYALPSSGG